MSRASDTTKGAVESYAGVVRQRPSGGVPRKRLRPLATFGGRMHPSDWSRLLTERQREVLTIVVENKVYRNRDSKIPELAAQMGIAPAAVAKEVVENVKTALPRSDGACPRPCTGRRPTAKTSPCGPPPRRPRKAEIGPTPSPSANVRRGRRGRRTRGRNGGTRARRRRLPDRNPRKEESRRG